MRASPRGPGTAAGPRGVLVGDDPASAVYVQQEEGGARGRRSRGSTTACPPTRRRPSCSRSRAAQRRPARSTASSSSCRCPRSSTATADRRASTRQGRRRPHPADPGSSRRGRPASCRARRAADARCSPRPTSSSRARERRRARPHEPRRQADGAAAAGSANATVTICHSRTRDLAAKSPPRRHRGRRGRPRRDGQGRLVKPGAVVIDVGINRTETGKLVGDVDFAAAPSRARAITPVPGGVGPMTIACLLATRCWRRSGRRRALGCAADAPEPPACRGVRRPRGGARAARRDVARRWYEPGGSAARVFGDRLPDLHTTGWAAVGWFALAAAILAIVVCAALAAGDRHARLARPARRRRGHHRSASGCIAVDRAAAAPGLPARPRDRPAPTRRSTCVLPAYLGPLFAIALTVGAVAARRPTSAPRRRTRSPATSSCDRSPSRHGCAAPRPRRNIWPSPGRSCCSSRCSATGSTSRPSARALRATRAGESSSSPARRFSAAAGARSAGP